MLFRSKCLCALSGIKLKSDNVSVDHIVAVSNGGTNSPNNIRLTTAKINRMRNTMEDKEFIELCKAITKHSVDN